MLFFMNTSQLYKLFIDEKVTENDIYNWLESGHNINEIYPIFVKKSYYNHNIDFDIFNMIMSNGVSYKMLDFIIKLGYNLVVDDISKIIEDYQYEYYDNNNNLFYDKIRYLLNHGFTITDNNYLTELIYDEKYEIVNILLDYVSNEIFNPNDDYRGDCYSSIMILIDKFKNDLVSKIIDNGYELNFRNQRYSDMRNLIEVAINIKNYSGLNLLLKYKYKDKYYSKMMKLKKLNYNQNKLFNVYRLFN